MFRARFRHSEFLHHEFGNLDHVVATVVLLGPLDRAAQLLVHAQAQRVAEHPHLNTRIVEVILALDLIAGGGQQTAQHVAHHGATRVADVERAGGVGADKLDQDPNAIAGAGLTECGSVGDDAAEYARSGLARHAEVDEARPRDRGLAHQPRTVEVIQQFFRNLARVAFHQFRQLHGDIGGIIAVLAVTRHFDEGLDIRARHPLRLQVTAQGRFNTFGK